MDTVTGLLKDIWREVLDRSDLTGDADFFELGGASIGAVQVAALVQERLGVALDAIEVIEHPQFSQLAALIRERDKSRS